jgi:hypothetical protein
MNTPEMNAQKARERREKLEAAAPALLAALKAYRKAFIETVGDPSVTSEMEAADKKARKAIRDATPRP